MASNGSTIRVALDLVTQTSGLSNLSGLTYALSSLVGSSTAGTSAADGLTRALQAQEIAALSLTRAQQALADVQETVNSKQAAYEAALLKQQIASKDTAAATQELADAEAMLAADNAMPSTPSSYFSDVAYRNQMEENLALAQQNELLANAAIAKAQDAYLTEQQALASKEATAQYQVQMAEYRAQNAQMAVNDAQAGQAAEEATAAMGPYIAVLLAAGVAAAGFDSALKNIVEDAAHLQYTTEQMDLSLHGTADQIAQLNPAIIQWADNSLYTTAQVHQLVQALSEHGLDVSSILNGDGQAAINFGEAIGGNPVDSANLLGSVLQQFSSQGLNAKDATDILTATFYNGIPSASQLQQAYDQVGGQAATMGVSFKDLSATLDLLAQAGLQGSSAASGLRYMLQTLDDPTTKAATDMNFLGLTVVNKTSPAFEQLKHKLDAAGSAGQLAVSNFDGTSVGLNGMFKEAQALNLIPLNQTFNEWAVSSGAMSSSLFDAKGHFIGLQGSMEQLFAAVQSKSGGNKEVMAQLLGDMFNVRSGRDAGLLANMTDFSGHYARVQAEMSKPNQAANDAAAMKGTAQGSWQQFQTTLTSFGSALGKDLLPPLTKFIQMLNTLVSNIMSINPAILQFTGLFILIGAIISTVVVIVVALAVVFMVVAAVVGGTVIVVFGIVIVIILVVAALAALIIMNWGKLGAFFGMLGQHIGAFFSGLGTWAHNAVVTVGNWFQQLGTWVHDHLTELVTKAKLLWDEIPVLFQAGLKKAEQIVQDALATVVGWFDWLYNHNYYFKDLVDFIRNTWNTIKQDAQDLWNGITGWLSNQWNIISTGATNRWNEIRNSVGHVFNMLGTDLHDALVGIEAMFSIAWKNVQNTVGLAFTALQSTVGKQFSNLGSAVKSGLDGVGKFFSDFGTTMHQFGVNMMHQFIGGIQQELTALRNTVGGVAANIARIMGFHSPPAEGPLADSDTYMPNMMRMYATGISAHTPLLTNAITNAANTSRFALTQGMAPQGLLLGGGGGSGVGGNQTVNVSVGNQQLFSLMMNHLTGQMQLNGLGRAFK